MLELAHSIELAVAHTGDAIISGDKWAVIVAALRTAAQSAEVQEREIIERCAKVIGDMRQSEAGLFDEKHSGQRGCDRTDALYDAYVAIRALAQGDLK
jgi:hypothetical protein